MIMKKTASFHDRKAADEICFGAQLHLTSSDFHPANVCGLGGSGLTGERKREGEGGTEAWGKRKREGLEIQTLEVLYPQPAEASLWAPSWCLFCVTGSTRGENPAQCSECYL